MTVATDWLTAIGTVGTLGATVTLFWVDRRHRNRDASRAQARLISGWSQPVDQGMPDREVTLVKLSDEPVYDVNVFLAPRRFDSGDKNTFYRSVLPPNKTAPLTRKVKRANPTAPLPELLPRIELAFTDQDGTRWLRDRNGELREIKGDNPESHRRDSPTQDTTSPG
jgi:hypothetical protein